jgi:hypothetical protein
LVLVPERIALEISFFQAFRDVKVFSILICQVFILAVVPQVVDVEEKLDKIAGGFLQIILSFLLVLLCDVRVIEPVFVLAGALDHLGLQAFLSMAKILFLFIDPDGGFRIE